MALNVSCATGLETAMDALQVIVDLALGYPRRGGAFLCVSPPGHSHQITIPASWDGNGPRPAGWLRHHVPVYVQSALIAALPMRDETVALLEDPEAQGSLDAGQITTLLAAIAARSTVDLEQYSPKRRSGAGVAPGSANGKRP